MDTDVITLGKELETEQMMQDSSYKPRKSNHPLVSTSLEALDDIENFAEALRRRVLGFLRLYPGSTQYECHKHFNDRGLKSRGGKELSYSGLRSRFCELEKMDMIRKGPKKVLKGERRSRFTYTVTGRIVPLTLNTGPTQKQKADLCIAAVIDIFNNTSDIIIRGKIKELLFKIGYIPVNFDGNVI